MRAALSLLLAILFAAGCATGQEARNAQHDAACRASGLEPGTEDYAECRAALAARAQEDARRRITDMQRVMDQNLPSAQTGTQDWMPNLRD